MACNHWVPPSSPSVPPSLSCGKQMLLMLIVKLSMHYIDDHYSFAIKGNLTYYPPYNKLMPTNRVKLLQLWDEINLPHDEHKQIFGLIITCISFDVDPNAVTVTMSPNRRLSLIRACEHFIKVGVQRSLHNFQHLQGHIN
jgi:hypothetical protein